MNFGTIYLDFYEPITISETLKEAQLVNPKFDPFTRREDRLKFNNDLGHKIVFTLRNHVRIMPTTLLASILLLYRKGISEE